MSEFTMDSLVGTDPNGEDIISLNDEWIEMDSTSYLDFFNDVRQDHANHLLYLSNISDTYSLGKNAKIHYIDSHLSKIA